MKVLLTGASSFTGHWFAQELSRAGHEVIATFQSAFDGYAGVRAARVASLAPTCRAVWECSFGSDQFLNLVRHERKIDLLCHHGADVTDYKSPSFDVITALARNTHRLPETLEVLEKSGCGRLILTGSVFENGEGAGSEGLPAFSPYGLSKALTAQFFRYHTDTRGLRLGKFVIPNPFGPLEEPRFTSYLARSWFDGVTPSVATPAYVRDNIHVSLLAKAYRQFAEDLSEGPDFQRSNPSGYVESQGGFAARVAEAMRVRLNLPCQVELREQAVFAEPRVRINTDPPDAQALGWSEDAAWDDLARYYRETFG